MKQRHIQHLYLRAGFGIGHDKLNKLRSKPKQDILNQLFSEAQHTHPLELDLSELRALAITLLKDKNLKKDKVSKQVFQKKNRQKTKEFNYAWIDRLKNPNAVLKEKMTLFWANVFVCRDNNIFYTQQYNNTLRKHSLGNFRDFVKAIAKEASMSRYLNNRQNIKESPNENFARELMELFTLGIGNYTEKDIKEAARAFTGWSFRKNLFEYP